MAPYTWTPTIVLHAVAAASALGLGALLLARRKGTASHRALGWAWVSLMALVAGSSFWIFRGSWSWIHGLSVFSLVFLVVGVRYARRSAVQAHRFTMISIFVGALLITGLFTLLPGRLIGQALWGM